MPGRDLDYPLLWQQMARIALQAQNYGPSAKRHLRLAMLQLAARNYPAAAHEAYLSLSRSIRLPEAHHVLGTAMLGQALVQEGLLEPGPGSPRPAASTRELVRSAAAAYANCAHHNPSDWQSAALERGLMDALAASDAELRACLRDVAGPAGP